MDLQGDEAGGGEGVDEVGSRDAVEPGSDRRAEGFDA